MEDEVDGAWLEIGVFACEGEDVASEEVDAVLGYAVGFFLGRGWDGGEVDPVDCGFWEVLGYEESHCAYAAADV